MGTNKQKQTQGVAYVNKVICCGFNIIFVERLHKIFPNLDDL